MGKNKGTFIGTCSNCRTKKTEVTKFKNGQLCINKCLPHSIARLAKGPAAVSAMEVMVPPPFVVPIGTTSKTITVDPVNSGGMATPLPGEENPIIVGAPNLTEGM